MREDVALLLAERDGGRFFDLGCGLPDGPLARKRGEVHVQGIPLPLSGFPSTPHGQPVSVPTGTCRTEALAGPDILEVFQADDLGAHGLVGFGCRRSWPLRLITIRVLARDASGQIKEDADASTVQNGREGASPWESRENFSLAASCPLWPERVREGRLQTL